MARTTGLVLCVAMVLVSDVAVGRQAAALTEPETGVTFPVRREIRGRGHVLVGTGARRAARIVKVFAAGMYVEVRQARAAWLASLRGRFAAAGLVRHGQPDFGRLPTSEALRELMIHGGFPRALELVFLRDVSGRQTRLAFEDGFRVAGISPESAGSGYEDLLEGLGRPIRRGDRVLIGSEGRSIWITWGDGETVSIAASPALVAGLWRTYFGRGCRAESLRDGLLSRVELLHEVATGSD